MFCALVASLRNEWNVVWYNYASTRSPRSLGDENAANSQGGSQLPAHAASTPQVQLWRANVVVDGPRQLRGRTRAEREASIEGSMVDAFM